MIYSDLYQRKQIRIPSIFAVLVIGVLSFFMTQFFLTPSRSTNATKRNILSMKIANVGSRRATILWRTTNKEAGMVLWGTGRAKLDHITLDERDSAQSRAEYFNHSVQLAELAPNTKYYFSLSNTKELLETAGTTTFSLSTTPTDSRINSLKPVYGTVTSVGGVMEKNVLVLFEYPGAYPLATLSKPSGEWLIPLNGLTRTKGTSLIAPGLSGYMMLPIVVLSDVIDDDAHRVGVRREGIFFGISGAVAKLSFTAQGLFYWITFALTGWRSGADVQTESAVWGIRFMMAGSPLIAALITIACLWFIRLRDADPRGQATPAVAK